MGLDLSAIPVRLDAEPVRRLLSDPDVFQDTTYRPPFTNRTWGEPLPPLNQALCAAHPNLSGWDSPYPDRSYEAAEFVLDPAAWRAATDWETRERSIAHRIIHGDHYLADHAMGGQGVRWRGSRAAFLYQAADTIDRLDLVAARRAFSLPELDDLGVYKVSVDHDNEEELFVKVTRNLARLAGYYRSVAERGLDLIIEKD